MLPYYVCTILFILPLLIALFLYSLDVSHLTDEIEKGGTIAESNPPEDAKDLTDVTVIQSCVFVCGMPCIIVIMGLDIFKAVKRAYDENYRDEPFCVIPEWCKKKPTEGGDEKPVQPKRSRKSTLWFRIWRTLVRCFTGARRNTSVVQPIDTYNPGLKLKELEKDREKEEREAREKISREQEEERQRLALKEAEANADFLRRQQQEEQEKLRFLEEKRLQEEKEERERKEAEEFANRWESHLSVTRYKAMWATLATNGSFQCTLKAMPVLNALTDHLKKQGFHVVFATNANANSIEIGICNIRPVGEESWFIARFLVSNNSFSAVMKATTADIVPIYVKKFALARVLKIEATK
jgi:phosphoglycolate phosphatase-like HAD superfamily hydrolase